MALERPAPRASIRSFIAIEIEGDARQRVERLLADLRASIDGVTWSRSGAMHVTVKFLGSVEGSRLEALIPRVERAASEHPAFTITLAGVGAFPSAKRPAVVWVGIDAPELRPLAAAVEEACAEEGFPRETRAFHPHLTLGRVRAQAHRSRRRATPPRETTSAARVAALLQAEHDTSFGSAPAHEVIVFRSDLGRDGARHTPLARCALGSALSTRR